MILKCVVGYAAIVPPSNFFEGAEATGSSADMHRMLASKAREQLLGRLGRLKAKLSPSERKLFYGSEITHRQRADASWRLEAFQVLLWALGQLSVLPPFDTLAEREDVKRFPPPEMTASFSGATLISSSVIDKARDVAELWHWRSRTRQLIERGDTLSRRLQTREVKSFDDIVRLAVRKAHDDGVIPPPIDDDFPALGKAYRALTADEWAMVASITRERHFALNWLCGYAPGNQWDRTPTDT